MPVPNPFYGPLLPPPQKMVFDYFQMQQLQQAPQPVIPPLPPLLSNIMNHGNQMPMTFQPSAHEHHNVRPDGYNQRYHNNMRPDYGNKSRR
ncbi:hypothetical protein OESDEN_13686 [Oesophagostomum dentatum]|uniref:Uncharacterized protein n=1 Tax=Oesophagostomum dentatum TaxID=61180 RepID=A0A0B1SSS3_OESDE|nr:hypothetical protein OESDEN_13686 [Oesophagostomum dentatum]